MCLFIHTSVGICRVEIFCCLSEFFLKQALKAMAQPGEPFIYLGKIGLPLLQLSSNAFSQNAYCFCCRQWLTESQLVASAVGSGQENSIKHPHPLAWILSRKEAPKTYEGNDTLYGDLYGHVCVS